MTVELSKKKPKETCALGSSGNHHQVDAKDEYSYIHEHLETLYFITTEFPIETILEIGTGDGYSTMAFAEALTAKRTGHIMSLDINPQCKGIEHVKQRHMDKRVGFITCDSLQFEYKGRIDLLFIDGEHGEDYVFKELKKFADSVSKGGFIILHDTTNPAYEVNKAFYKYSNWMHDKFGRDVHSEFNEYNWFNCNGLKVLRKLV